MLNFKFLNVNGNDVLFLYDIVTDEIKEHERAFDPILYGMCIVDMHNCTFAYLKTTKLYYIAS